MVVVHCGLPQLVEVHLAETLVALDLDLVVAALALELCQQLVLLGIRVGVPDLLALLYSEERRLCSVYVSALDERCHISEEECQKQCSDVRSVDVSIRHDDDLVVAQLADVEVLADVAAEGRDHVLDLL